MRLWPGLVAWLCLAGCSVQIAYNNLDRLARWSVSDYVDMSDAQRAYFDARFGELWAWHRRDHLPQYADFLDDFSARLGDPTSEAEMQALVDRVIGWADEIEARSMPMAAELLASLNDDQVARLAAGLEQSNRELAEPELGAPPDQVKKQWREEFAERFTRFSGRLTAVQKAYLARRSADYRPELVLWADYRRRWQRDFLALLDHRHDVERLERGLRRLTARRERHYGSELAEVYDHNVRLTREASVWLMNSLTDRQQQRFADRLDELAEDFRELAAQDPPRQSGEPAPCLVGC